MHKCPQLFSWKSCNVLEFPIVLYSFPLDIPGCPTPIVYMYMFIVHAVVVRSATALHGVHSLEVYTNFAFFKVHINRFVDRVTANVFCSAVQGIRKVWCSAVQGIQKVWGIPCDKAPNSFVHVWGIFSLGCL